MMLTRILHVTLAFQSCFLCKIYGFQNPLSRKIVSTSSSSDGIWKSGEHESSSYSSGLASLSMTETPSEEPSSSFRLPNRSRRTQHKDIVIVGSGLAGLSTALYLSQLDPDRHITVLDRQEHDVDAKKKTTISSFAAAGMLAPQSERLPGGPLLKLCLASRKMYPEFCDLVESMAKESGEDGAKYLLDKNSNNNNNSDMEPWSVGYMQSGGFLAPAFAGDSVATWAPPDDGGSATWLDEIQVRELEPNLHPDVVGGWWFPEDASVDARRLTCSLHAACIAAGVQFLCGKPYEVSSLDLNDGKCNGIWLKSGSYFKTKDLLVANGAWMRNLLPVPIEPHKGQSLSLKMPADRPPILRRVLFAQDSYIVPKADGNIVIGATVEAGSFDGNVTPAGLLHILTHALQLVPGLQNLPVVETWAGLRPTTPDKGPILGKSPWENLYLAGGYWRNGVLLSPKTAQLMASLITKTKMSPEDEKLLAAFSWDRFTVKGGGAALAANARYAASMHPIHSRVSGAGVAAAVGTELGSYSTAKAAKDERQKERSSLWGDDNDDAFERAAELGRRDATTFSMGDDAEKPKSLVESPFASSPSPVFFPEAAKSSASVGSATETEDSVDTKDLTSVYQSIKDNKKKHAVTLPSSEEEKSDPGFRIYHIDSKTGKCREVPPYTQPAEFLESIKKEGSSSTPLKSDERTAATISSIESDESPNGSEGVYNEKTYDGYQAIEETNAGKSRAEQMEAMRKARSKNRLGQEEIDESKIGAKEVDVVPPNSEKDDDEMESSTNEVTSAYQTILDNKAKQNQKLPSPGSDEKKDPGFRIHHVDAETGESREVPPYTAPADFFNSINKGHAEKESGTRALKSEGVNGVPKEGEHNRVNGEDRGSGSSGYNEKTYDGYQAILEANSGNTREDQLEAMRHARLKNREGQTGIDESKLD